MIIYKMSFLSGANSDLVLKNLLINGKLTLNYPIQYTDDYPVDPEDDANDTSDNKVYENVQVINDLSTNNLYAVNSTLTNVTITEDLMVTNLNVSQDTSLNDLYITGSATIETLSVSGTATLQELTVVSNSTFDNVTINGNAVTQNLDVNEALTVDSITCINLDVTTDTSLNTLNVAGDSTLEKVDINGDLGVKNITVSEDCTLNGVVAINNDVSVSENVTITGNLTVMGEITGNTSESTSNMEIQNFHLTGSATTIDDNVSLQQNTTGTTDYCVFPSIYYGYTGSSGTYGVNGGSLSEIMISNITSTGFAFNLTKSGGDNVNLYIIFLIVYNLPNSDYPKTYSS